MKIYDISQEVFSCSVYPGDPVPEKETLVSIENGDAYNLTAFRMCAHNGTHVDAPFHFIAGGNTIERIAPERFIGPCFVFAHEGDLLAADALRALSLAENAGGGKRLLIKGNATVTQAAAEVFADAGIWLIGSESQSVGPLDKPMAVHKALLSRNVVLLEGIRLHAVSQGPYFLFAAPINLAGCDGAPCRAVLIREDRFCAE